MSIVQPLGRIYYPGINSILGGTYSCGRGTPPGMIYIEFMPQRGDLPSVGDVRLNQGSFELYMRQCRLVNTQRNATEGGWTMRAAIEDPRWKWRHATISGRWNARNDLNIIYEPTKLSARSIVKNLINKLPINSGNLSDLPDDDYPEVDWLEQNVNEALEMLCQRYRCVVCFDPFAEILNIKRLGSGQDLSSGLPLLSEADGQSLQAWPEKIAIAFGPSIFQKELPLTPVGLSRKGLPEWERKLDYRPANGFEKAFNGQSLLGEQQDGKFPLWLDGDARKGLSVERQLGNRSVFKWYQVLTKELSEGGTPFTVEDPKSKDGKTYTIKQLEQILPLGTRLPQPYTFLDKKQTFRQESENIAPELSMLYNEYAPARVWGTYYRQNLLAGNADINTPDDEIRGNGVKSQINQAFGVHQFQIDPSRAMVMFDQPIFKMRANADTAFAFPELILQTGISVREKVDDGFVHHVIERDMPNSGRGTGKRVIQHFEWQMRVWYDLNESGSKGEVKTNEDQLKKIADYYLDAIEREYLVASRAQGNYLGWHRFVPDGAIAEVTWGKNIGEESPCYTTAGYNMEPWAGFFQPSYEERLMRQINAKSADRLRLMNRFDVTPSQLMNRLPVFPEMLK